MLQALAKPAKAGKNDAVVTDFSQVKVPDSAVADETDEQIIERTRLRFEILKDMTKAVKTGDVRAMIRSSDNEGAVFQVHGFATCVACFQFRSCVLCCTLLVALARHRGKSEPRWQASWVRDCGGLVRGCWGLCRWACICACGSAACRLRLSSTAWR